MVIRSPLHDVDFVAGSLLTIGMCRNGMLSAIMFVLTNLHGVAAQVKSPGCAKEKSNGTQSAEHDLKKCTELMIELLRVSEDSRVGPVGIDERGGRPYLSNHFRQLFRRIKDAVGWSKDLWNMDLRAGAVSEAF
jgi:hypothetical protein